MCLKSERYGLISTFILTHACRDTEQLNALDWQRQFGKRFIQAYLGVNEWLQVFIHRLFSSALGQISFILVVS